MHEDPAVPNTGRPAPGPRLRSGNVLAIEPMVSAGTDETVVLDDGWSVVTADGAWAAHTEHTVAVTDDGPEILTALLRRRLHRRADTVGRGRRACVHAVDGGGSR